MHRLIKHFCPLIIVWDMVIVIEIKEQINNIKYKNFISQHGQGISLRKMVDLC